MLTRAPVLVNESVASSPVIEYVTPTPVQCPQLQFIKKTVEIPDFLLCQGTQTAESSEIAPVRHVSFAETVEVVEFEPHHTAVPVCLDPVVQGVAYAVLAKYNAPAATMAYRVHAAPAPAVCTRLQHWMRRTGHMRHLLPWLNATLQHRL